MGNISAECRLFKTYDYISDLKCVGSIKNYHGRARGRENDKKMIAEQRKPIIRQTSTTIVIISRIMPMTSVQKDSSPGLITLNPTYMPINLTKRE